MIGLRDVLAEKGEKLTRGKWNLLVRWAMQQLAVRGDVYVRQMPNGRLIRAVAGPASSSGATAIAWSLTLQAGQNGMELHSTAGNVNGVPCRIDGRELDQTDDAGNTPSLPVSASDFGPDRLCRVYVRAKFLDQPFAVQAVELVTRPTPPDPEPYYAYKCVNVLTIDDGGTMAVADPPVAVFHLTLAATVPQAGRASFFWGCAG